MKLIKKIISEGTYRVLGKDGQRITRSFDKDYILKLANNSNQMLLSGLKIPTPFDHIKDARPKTEDEVKVFENQPAKAFNNAGYWTRFFIKENDGKVELYGEVDAPGDDTDINSPAYKLKNTNSEVSMSIADQFEDGLGRKWTDSILHVAVVNHPVVPNQTPFEDGVTVVNMSMMEPGSDTENEIDQLKGALVKLGITLPSSTNPATFLRDLLVAVLQLPNRDTEPLEPVPIYMSIQGEDEMKLTEDQAKALVSSKATNPATGKEFTMNDLGFAPKVETPADINMSALQHIQKERDQFKALAQVYKNKLADFLKNGVKERINKLVSENVITKEFADASLAPKVEFQMSIIGTEIQDHPLEVTLSTLEQGIVRARGTSHNGLPPGAVVQDPPVEDHGQELTDAEIQRALDAMDKDNIL